MRIGMWCRRSAARTRVGPHAELVGHLPGGQSLFDVEPLQLVVSDRGWWLPVGPAGFVDGDAGGLEGGSDPVGW